MSAHAFHSMHENSLAAHAAEEARLGKRAQAILAWIAEHGPHTDREVARGMGFPDMNAARPRITELVQRGKLIEVCSRKCSITGKTVRVVDVRRPRQETLFPCLS